MRDLLETERAAMVATAELSLSETDWPRFRSVLADFAVRGGWAMNDCPQPRSLGGSLWRPGADGGGAHVAYKQWRWPHRREERATLYVVAPPDEGAWRPVTAALFRRLDQEWPGALSVKGATQ